MSLKFTPEARKMLLDALDERASLTEWYLVFVLTNDINGHIMRVPVIAAVAWGKKSEVFDQHTLGLDGLQ